MKKKTLTGNIKYKCKAVGIAVLASFQLLACAPGDSGESKTQTEASSSETVSEAEDEETKGSVSGEDEGAETAENSGETEAENEEADSLEGTEAKPGAPLKEGNKAPDFTAQLVDGTTLTLSDLKGKPVIINFWATWCGPCVREMPAFQKLWEEYSDQAGVIAVNCGDSAEDVASFAEENGYTFPIALDESYEISMLYPTNGIPYTVILDENGKITHISTGALDADTMFERYKEALGL